MKKVFMITIILLALAALTSIIWLAMTALTSFQVQVSQSAGTEVLPNMPNPAAVDCEIGKQLVIQTAADGSQSIECVDPDGSAPSMPNPAAVDCEIGKQLVIKTAADGSQSSECVDPDGSGGYMPPESTEEIADWWGVIKSNPPGAQYDDYFERQDLGQIIYFGIDSMDPAVKSQIKALRDSGKIVHLYGRLLSNVPDFNGSQIQVDRIEVEE
jgi:putative hemolysin